MSSTWEQRNRDFALAQIETQMAYIAAEIEVKRLRDENEKLQNRLELLLTILRNDCDIDASWDGLRGFWTIELTEGGCLMRDRACKAEAENANLRELVRISIEYCNSGTCDECPIQDDDGSCPYAEMALKLGIEEDG